MELGGSAGSFENLPGSRAESVFHVTWHQPPPVPAGTIDWDALMRLRTDVTRLTATGVTTNHLPLHNTLSNACN